MCERGLLTAPMSIVVSPDGANAYVTSRPALDFLVPDGALVVFDRAPDGSLVQKVGRRDASTRARARPARARPAASSGEASAPPPR
jgi:hypothetical protein